MATGRRQLLVQYCIILNHISFFGSKKEGIHALCICEGDPVSVEKHDKHWIHLGCIISMDKNTKTAVVKWKETRKKDTVHLGDCKKVQQTGCHSKEMKINRFLL